MRTYAAGLWARQCGLCSIQWIPEDQFKKRPGNPAKNSTGPFLPIDGGASPMVAHAHAEPEYLSLVTAAEILDVNERTVRNWIRDGRIPAYRMGPRQIRVKRADLESLLKPVRLVS